MGDINSAYKYLTPFTGYIRCLRCSDMTPLGRSVFNYAFPEFFNKNELSPEELKNQVEKMDKYVENVYVDKLSPRRFAGDFINETFPRSRYYTIAQDASGNDNRTLIRELLAYSNTERTSPLITADAIQPDDIKNLKDFGLNITLRDSLIIITVLPGENKFTAVGIRDIGGDLTGEIETIIVEVKRGSEAFATASGQAYGYTVYANRIYLADKRQTSFTALEIQIASHLGIGLIKIDAKNKCSIVLTSPYYRPMIRMNADLLEKVHLGKCQLCENYIEIGNAKNRYTYLAKDKINKALEEEKGVVFWNRQVNIRKEKHGVRIGAENTTYERRFLCSDCIKLLGQLKDK